MLIKRDNPKGLDWYIQQLQTKVHDRLIDADHLNLSDSALYKCHDRAYRNKTRDGYTAQVYKGGGEYEEVYWDDSQVLISFFGISDAERVEVQNEANVHLVFFANLDKLQLKDSAGNVAAHRTDAELRTMVQSVIGRNSYGFSIVSIEQWLENVLREYPGSRRDDRLAAVDMHPVHCFRVNLQVRYSPNKIC